MSGLSRAQSSGDDLLEEALTTAGLDTVAGAFAYGGGQDLSKPSLGSRRRTRIELADRAGQRHILYLKRYGPEGLIARLRRGWTYGWGVGPARAEFDNIHRAQAAGVPTMRAVRFGQERRWFGIGRGYMIASAIPGEALERCAEKYLAAGGEQAGSKLAAKLAELVAKLHRAGYVHRDLYASHIFLHESTAGIELYLIDLARMFRPRWRRFRWRTKDLAQLKFSMLPSWVQRHWADFMHRYLAGCGEGQAARYNRRVDRKAAAIARRWARKRARESKKRNA